MAQCNYGNHCPGRLGNASGKTFGIYLFTSRGRAVGEMSVTNGQGDARLRARVCFRWTTDLAAERTIRYTYGFVDIRVRYT